jgi:CRISPR-associated endonuclease/helicase Cas3
MAVRYLFSLLTWAERVDAAFNDKLQHEMQHISPILWTFSELSGFDEPNTVIDC